MKLAYIIRGRHDEQMSTKFFTNDGKGTLLGKFAAVFEHNPQLVAFDALAAYFRATGYFRLRPHLERIGQVRILVGIDVDRLSGAAQRTGLALRFGADQEQVAQDFRHKFKKEIADAPYDSDLEDGVLRFVEDVSSGKVVIKAHPSRRLHAKIYIFRPENFNEHSGGEVITGSSNLTEAGLGASDRDANYEFNVSLRDYDDVKFATDEFERLWREAVDILPEAVVAAKDETHLSDDCTANDLYLKLLIEYFGKEIEFDPDRITDVPRGFKRLNYQMDAVEQGYTLLDRHRGFFLADVVGLGKTFIAIMIARKYFFMNDYPEYRSHTLVVCPPAVKANWRETIDDFRLDNPHFITTGSLHKIDDPDKYDLIIVDEAHKFRNNTSESYAQLQRIANTPCRNGKAKRVILVSATPLNNRPDDLKNQILLFQDANNGTLDVNLARFFSEAERRYSQLIRKTGQDDKDNKAKLHGLFEQIRLKIIEPLTVRRTRGDLLEHPLYAEDLREQGVVFPTINKPQTLLYPLSRKLNELYEQTVARIQNRNGAGLQYARHRLIEFLKPEHKKDYQRADFIVKQLTAIMKTLLVKRLDSSFHAFHRSLRRALDASDMLLKMWADDRIIIAPSVDLQKYIEEGKEEDEGAELMAQLEREQATNPGLKILTRDDFEQGWHGLMERDHAILREMEQQWRQANTQPDPKLAELLKQLPATLLAPRQNPERKLVIFSEAADTTDYLAARLREEDYRVLAVTAQNRGQQKEAIEQNFDAKRPPDKQKSDYDVIIATEALAEGVNLHRANTIVNYDTPWNATRLMQRIGRINRIGGKAEQIYIYNFLPTEQVEGDINLRHRAQVKLQAFHSILGEDSQIYTPDEEYKSFGLFDKNITEEREISERLACLMEIRRFREQHPDEFKRIKNLPLKIRNAVPVAGAVPDDDDGDDDGDDGGTIPGDRAVASPNATLCFLRNPAHDAFYQVEGYRADDGNGGDDDGRVKELGFLEAVAMMKAHKDAETKPLPAWHHPQVKAATGHFARQIQEKAIAEQQTPQLNLQQREAIEYVRVFCDHKVSGDEEKQRMRQAMEWIKIGRSQPLPRDLQKLKRSQKKSPTVPALQLEAILKIIDKHVPPGTDRPERTAPAAKPDTPPRIIISQSYL